MKTIWNEASRAEMRRRIDRLTPETRPRWGTMTANEMIAHVLEGMRMGLGELETRQRYTFLRRWPFKHLFVYWIPFPKGAPAPREIVTKDKPHDWDANLAALHDSLIRFAQRERGGTWPAHPVFGELDGRAWGALGWRHLDHHLRQFGV